MRIAVHATRRNISPGRFDNLDAHDSSPVQTNHESRRAGQRSVTRQYRRPDGMLRFVDPPDKTERLAYRSPVAEGSRHKYRENASEIGHSSARLTLYTFYSPKTPASDESNVPL